MHVGLIAPPWVAVPPGGYGGTEAVIDNLARGLRARGHEVTLFTVGGSTCPVRHQALFDEPVAPMGMSVPEAAHVIAAYDALRGVDIIHDHTVLGPLVAGARRGTPPVVVTNHGPFTDLTRPIFAQIAHTASIVAISHSQARSARGLPIRAVIHHGIDLDVYRPGPGDGEHLMFIGRMSPDKGVHHAVRVARMTGRRLVISTKMREPAEHAYFNEQVRPLLSADDELPAEIPLTERLALLGAATAVLNPICWREPFGLVMAESLACATPVLAFPKGAAPEIVTHGRTGALCATEEEMVAELEHVDRIDRAECRSDADRRFSLDRMARDHEELYRGILGERRPRERAMGALRTGRRLPADGGRVHDHLFAEQGRRRGPGASRTNGPVR